jgi:endonuclease/exonuclease/phosphatase family metal-dependent hydrolase
VLWNSSIFSGEVLEIHRSAVRVKFSSAHNNQPWQLVCVYGPCSGPERDIFVQWLHDLDIPLHDNWLLLGDFNFMRSIENRNKPGVDMNDIFLFNEIISHLGLIELPLKGRSFTWSNMQDSPLLQQIDWFFTSCQWTLSFPDTVVHPLAKNTSDHVPCVVKIKTTIPKAKIFRFESH